MNTVDEHNKSDASKEERSPVAVDAGIGEGRGKNPAAAEQEIKRLEDSYLNGSLSESEFCAAVSRVQERAAS